MKVGDRVEFRDPWFYPGTGLVVELQHQPHEAVKVQILTIEDSANQHWMGRETWLLRGNVSLVTE